MKKIEAIASLLQTGKLAEAQIQIEEIIGNGRDDERLLLGEYLFEQGFLNEAERLLTALLFSYPNEGELLLFLAEIKLEKGEEDEAILTLEKIASDDDIYPRALLLLADLYEMEGLFEVSEQKLVEAKRLLPDERAIDFALGEFYAAQGQFEQALVAYSLVSEDETLREDVNIDERIAEVLSASGAFEEALPYYEKALETRLEINTLFQYGLTALQVGENKLAIKNFLQLKELDYEYNTLYPLLAQAYEKENELEKSLETIQAGLALDEYNKELFFYGGKLALKLNKEAEAEKLFHEALALDPSYSEVVIRLNALFRKQDRYEDVIQLLEDIARYEEEDPQFLWDKAFSLEKLEKYPQALTAYEKAYEHFETDLDFLNDYGYFLIEEGKLQEAKAIFEKLLLIEPTNEEYIEIMDRLENDLLAEEW